jgi:hypothetical protein
MSKKVKLAKATLINGKVYGAGEVATVEDDQVASLKGLLAKGKVGNDDADAEAKAKAEAEELAKLEAEEKAKADAEAKAKK